MVSISVWTSCACTNQIPGSQKNKKLEPVTSTSRRGARAAYHDECPRDFGPRIAYTVSLVSDTSRPPTVCRPPNRQGGREMSAPRPYETYLFYPPALFTTYTLSINFLYIPKCSSYSFHAVLEGSLIRPYNCHPRMRFPWTTRSPQGKVQGQFEIILPFVNKYMTFAHARRNEIVNYLGQWIFCLERK